MTPAQKEIWDEVDRFWEQTEREHSELPRAVIVELLRMPDGQERDQLALKLLPHLLRMVRSTIARRWRTAEKPYPGVIVTVHASRHGFISGWYSSVDGRWYTRDVEGNQREIEVFEWRHCEGKLAEPWHDDEDDLWPPEDNRRGDYLPRARITGGG